MSCKLGSVTTTARISTIGKHGKVFPFFLISQTVRSPEKGEHVCLYVRQGEASKSPCFRGHTWPYRGRTGVNRLESQSRGKRASIAPPEDRTATTNGAIHNGPTARGTADWQAETRMLAGLCCYFRRLKENIDSGASRGRAD